MPVQIQQFDTIGSPCGTIQETDHTLPQENEVSSCYDLMREDEFMNLSLLQYSYIHLLNSIQNHAAIVVMDAQSPHKLEEIYEKVEPNLKC